MSVSIGPKIGIDGEAQYRKELQNIIQSTKTLESQMKACASAFDKDSKATDKAYKKSKLLKEQQKALEKECVKLREAVSKSAEKYGEADTKTLKWKKALAEAEAQLNEVNAQLKDTSYWKAWSEELEQAGQKIKSVGDSISSVGKDLTTKISAPIAALATASVKTAADFDSAMSQVQATMGTTKDASSELNGSITNTMDALSDLAQSLGESTSFSATEAAEGINYLAQAGYDTQQIYDALPSVLNLAAAGSMDLASAADMVAGGLASLGMSADDAATFADVRATTASNAKTDVSGMGEALTTVGGTAKSLKGGLNEAATVLGIFANNAIEGAEGGTHLRNIILAMTPSTESAKKAWEELGVSAYDANGDLRSLEDVFADLNTALDGMSSEDRTAILQKMFNKTDLASVEALLSGVGDEWDNLASAIDNSSGSAEQMANTQLDNLNGKLTLLKSALEGAAIATGERLMPYIEDITDKVQGAVDWFNSLSDSQLDMIVKIAAVVAVIGPALVILGTVISTVGSIASGVGAVVGVLGALSPAMALTVAGITAAIAIGIALYKNWDKISAYGKKVAENCENAFTQVKSTVTDNVNQANTAVSNAFSGIYNSVKDKMESAKTVVSNAITKIKGLFNTTLSFPKIKMPHFTITGSFSFNPPSVPKVSVEWYKKGYSNAVMFNSPTVLATSAGYKGFGDGNGAEVVTGETHLMQDMYEVVNSVMGGYLQRIDNVLTEYLPDCANSSIYLDGKTLVGATAGQMNKTLGKIAVQNSRGVI